MMLFVPYTQGKNSFGVFCHMNSPFAWREGLVWALYHKSPQRKMADLARGHSVSGLLFVEALILFLIFFTETTVRRCRLACRSPQHRTHDQNRDDHIQNIR